VPATDYTYYIIGFLILISLFLIYIRKRKWKTCTKFWKKKIIKK
jgi:LPXTG-motif cell wall-anchored protein